jgi:predicted nucleic-acid-binding Zn-ribbon protein
MSQTKNCPKCRGKMVRSEIEIETSDTGVPSWRIRGAELVAYVCGKCGYIEFYTRERMRRE